jgi:hypothetical protein
LLVFAGENCRALTKNPLILQRNKGGLLNSLRDKELSFQSAAGEKAEKPGAWHANCYIFP